MKRMCSIICLLAVCLLTGCASADAQEQDPVFTAETAAATASETSITKKLLYTLPQRFPIIHPIRKPEQILSRSGSCLQVRWALHS